MVLLEVVFDRTVLVTLFLLLPPNGVEGVPSPHALHDVTLKSGEEIIIFSGISCGGENGDCGYY